jgi:hypothetical protein
VRVERATVRDTSTTAEGLEVTVDDGSGPLDVLIDAEVPISFNLFVPGAVFDYTGVLVPRPGGRSWILKPRSRADVSAP